MTIVETIRAAEGDVPAAGAAALDLDALNAVPVTLGQLSAARQILAGLAENYRWDPVARREALRAELGVMDDVVDAVDVRLVALRKWEDLHDRDRLLGQLHLMDAAAIARLFDTDHGIGFHDATFGELVEFVSELPW